MPKTRDWVLRLEIPLSEMSKDEAVNTARKIIDDVRKRTGLIEWWPDLDEDLEAVVTDEDMDEGGNDDVNPVSDHSDTDLALERMRDGYSEG